MSNRAIALQKTNRQGVLYLTGGGSELISELLTTPGASKTLLQVNVPYAAQALYELLGGKPEQACSTATARALAMSAFQRAQRLGGTQPFGLGCTAALATDRVKRGRHRAHVAVQTLTRSLDLRYDFNSQRDTEERALLEGLWYALSEALDNPLQNNAGTPTSRTLTEAPLGWQSLWSGRQAALQVTGKQDPQHPQLVLPGSFNPLHAGHIAMLSYAEKVLGSQGVYELAIANVDKPPLDYSSVQERLSTFKDLATLAPVWLTTLPTFVEKAAAFPGATFAVGADTLIRIADPKYYGDEAHRDRALAELSRLGTRFLVFGRNHEDGFVTLGDLDLPPGLRSLCQGVSEADFRKDISSTQLRQRARQDSQPG